jgi:hypothetical protein
MGVTKEIMMIDKIMDIRIGLREDLIIEIEVRVEDMIGSLREVTPEMTKEKKTTRDYLLVILTILLIWDS